MRPLQLDWRVVLVRPRNPLNIGAAARALANFGFRDMVVVAPDILIQFPGEPQEVMGVLGVVVEFNHTEPRQVMVHLVKDTMVVQEDVLIQMENVEVVVVEQGV